MKAFIERMTFPRWVILTCLVVAIPLGWIGWNQARTVKRLEQELAQVEDVVEEIQILSMRLTKLQEQAKSENLRGEGQIDSYIRRIASDERVVVGQVDLDPHSKTLANDVVDKQVSVKPSDAKRPFTRAQLANFFYKLETDSRRVKVTDVEIEPVEKRVRAEDVLDDRWTFEVTITSRQKTGG
jgi:hypothetical protein